MVYNDGAGLKIINVRKVKNNQSNVNRKKNKSENLMC